MPERKGLPPGVPTPTLFEESTPVEYPSSADMRRATAGDIGRLEGQLAAHAAFDVKGLGEVKDDVKRVEDKTDRNTQVLLTVSNTLSDVREKLATTSTHVESIVRNQKRQIRVETAQEIAAVDDTADKRKTGRKLRVELVLTALKWVSPLIVAGVTILVERLIRGHF